MKIRCNEEKRIGNKDELYSRLNAQKTIFRFFGRLKRINKPQQTQAIGSGCCGFFCLYIYAKHI